MQCKGCQMLTINGLACHETGCPEDRPRGCALCQTALRKREVFYANDWDGIEYCRECAERTAQFEAEEDARFQEEEAEGGEE
jgi:hypothetical protein